MLSGQNVMCKRGFILQSDWHHQSQAPEVNNFSHGCYQALRFLTWTIDVIEPIIWQFWNLRQTCTKIGLYRLKFSNYVYLVYLRPGSSHSGENWHCSNTQHVQYSEHSCFMCWKWRKVKKAGSHRESNPGHLWLETPVLCHWATSSRQPPPPTVSKFLLFRIVGVSLWSIIHCRIAL